jgi:hypothetical protein
MKQLSNGQLSFERLRSETGNGTILRLRHLATGVSVERVIVGRQTGHEYREMLKDLNELVSEFQKVDDISGV